MLLSSLSLFLGEDAELDLDPFDPIIIPHHGHQVELVRHVSAQFIREYLGEVAGRTVMQLGVVEFLGDAVFPVLVLAVGLVVVVTQIH